MTSMEEKTAFKSTVLGQQMVGMIKAVKAKGSFACSDKICQYATLHSNSNADPKFTVSAVAFPSAIRLTIILLITLACVACKLLKKKKEDNIKEKKTKSMAFINLVKITKESTAKMRLLIITFIMSNT